VDITLIQFVVLALSIKELLEARAYYKQQKKKWAIASACMGVFGCACVIVSRTGIV